MCYIYKYNLKCYRNLVIKIRTAVTHRAENGLEEGFWCTFWGEIFYVLGCWLCWLLKSIDLSLKIYAFSCR